MSADNQIPDPTNPQQFNRYSYVTNNPLHYTDPSGHAANDGKQDKTGAPVDGAGGGGDPVDLPPDPPTPPTVGGNDYAGKTIESDGTIHPTGETEAEAVTKARAGETAPADAEAEAEVSDETSQGLVQPEVSNPKLKNYADQYYKGINNPNRVGNGTTADAVRYEQATNQPVGEPGVSLRQFLGPSLEEQYRRLNW